MDEVAYVYVRLSQTRFRCISDILIVPFLGIMEELKLEIDHFPRLNSVVNINTKKKSARIEYCMDTS